MLAAWQQEGRQARSSGTGKFPGGLVIRSLGFHYRGRVQPLVRELKFPLKKKKKCSSGTAGLSCPPLWELGLAANTGRGLSYVRESGQEHWIRSLEARV